MRAANVWIRSPCDSGSSGSIAVNAVELAPGSCKISYSGTKRRVFPNASVGRGESGEPVPEVGASSQALLAM